MKIVIDGDGNIRKESNFIIRQDIEVIPADEPKQLKLGWTVRETIGIAVVNPRAMRGFVIKKGPRYPISIDSDGNIK